nr:hypothetical protein [Tanacetum cinerariifolium]
LFARLIEEFGFALHRVMNCGKACVYEDDMTYCETRTDLASQAGQSCAETCRTAGYDPPQMIVIIGTTGDGATLGPGWAMAYPILSIPMPGFVLGCLSLDCCTRLRGIISLPLDSEHVLMSDENQKTMHKFQPIIPCGFGCNRVGYPMEAVNIFEKYRCKSGGCILRWQCYEMREFGKPVHYHPHSHFFVRRWKVSNEVHRDIGPRTAPIATPDASVVISNGSEKFGSANVIGCDITVFSDWNAFAAFLFQVKVACFRISVSGEAM